MLDMVRCEFRTSRPGVEPQCGLPVHHRSEHTFKQLVNRDALVRQIAGLLSTLELGQHSEECLSIARAILALIDPVGEPPIRPPDPPVSL